MMGGKDIPQILQRVGAGPKGTRCAGTTPATRRWTLQLGHYQPPHSARPPRGHRKSEGHLLYSRRRIEGQVQVLTTVHAAEFEAARLEVVLAFKDSICLRGLRQFELLKVDAQLLDIAAEGLDGVGVELAGQDARILDDGSLLAGRSADLEVGWDGERERVTIKWIINTCKIN